VGHEAAPLRPTSHSHRACQSLWLFGTSERFWLNLPTRYDLEVEKDRLKTRLKKEVVPLRRAG
jgi:plasmid maintenance system antidote protein VapI